MTRRGAIILALWWLAVAAMLTGCSVNVTKRVCILAMPGATVSAEQNSTTDASGNTASPDVSAEVPLIP